jgi:hypothetical protein
MPKCTKQVYEQVAYILSQATFRHEDPAENKVVQHIASLFVMYFRGDNSRFDEDRFLKACGFMVEPPKKMPKLPPNHSAPSA